jgi:hypothetical protein
MDEMDALFGDDSDEEVQPEFVESTPSAHQGQVVSNHIEIVDSIAGVGGGRGLRAKCDIPTGTLILSEIPSISFDNMNVNKSEANSLNNKYDMANAIEAIVKSSIAYQCAKYLFPKKLSDIDGAEVLKMKVFLSAIDSESNGAMETETPAMPPAVNLLELLCKDLRQLNRTKLPDHQYFKYIHEVTESEVLRLALVLQHNCFGSGLYRFISIINHSCMPNCIKFAPTAASLGASEIYATRNIVQGEEITINYCFPCETSYQSAKDYLMENHTFECLCPRCSALKEPEAAPTCDPEESQTEGSLKVTGANLQTAFAVAKGTTISAPTAAEKKAAAALEAASAAVKLELEKEVDNEELLVFIEESEMKVADAVSPPPDAIVTWGETSKTCKEFMVQSLERCAEVLRLDVSKMVAAGLLPGKQGGEALAATVPVADISKLFVAALMCMNQTRSALQTAGASFGTGIFKHKLRFTTITLLTRLCNASLRAGHTLVDHYFSQLNNPKLSQARLFEQKQKVEVVLLQMVCVTVISLYLQTKSHILLGKWVNSSGKESAPSCSCEHPDMITTCVDLVSSMECILSLQGQYKPPADCATAELESVSVMYSLLNPDASNDSYATVFNTVASAGSAKSKTPNGQLRELCALFSGESKRLKKLYNTMLNYNRPNPRAGDGRPIVQVLKGPGDVFWG